jgi:hypothetical protein
MANLILNGSTSGSVTLSSPAVSGTTTLTLPTTNGTVLTSASSVTSSQLPTGSIVQVIYASTTTAFNTSSATYVATPLTATITKSFSTSKILILASPNVQAYNNGGANAQVGGMMYDTTNSRQIIDFICINRDYVSGSVIHVSSPNLSLQAYDTNSGTGSRQYTFYIKNIEGTSSHLNLDSNGQATSTIVLMEVVG